MLLSTICSVAHLRHDRRGVHTLQHFSDRPTSNSTCSPSALSADRRLSHCTCVFQENTAHMDGPGHYEP